MMKRGLFGCDLKHQVTVIGITYCALSILGIVFGALLLDRPEKFADQDITEKVHNETAEETNLLLNEDDDILESLIEYSDDIESSGELNEDVVTEEIVFEEASEKIEPSTEEKHYDKIIEYLKKEGIETIIGSFLKLFCSILLVQGARKGNPWFLVPWLVEETIEMVGGFIHFTIQATRNKNWSAGAIIMGMFFFLLGCYFLYSVASFHALLRRMKKNSSMIVASVSQGVTGGFQSGLNYQRLEEECWQSQPNIASEFSRPGFVREKKVDLEDNGDEHVLYVQ